MFLRLYHWSSFKNRLVADFLVWSGSSVSFPFGFCHSLSLIGEIGFRIGDGRVWNPNSSDEVSCKFFFFCLLDHSPISEAVFFLLFGG